MNIILYNNMSERIAVNKTLDNEVTLTGTLRDETDIRKPTILITYAGILDRNYAYIPEFGRYYYIDDIVSVRTGIWRVSMVCDVLMSFKGDILASPAIIDHTEETNITEYMDSPIWQTLVKTKTDILNFPNGLLETGEYILITAGGNQ